MAFSGARSVDSAQVAAMIRDIRQQIGLSQEKFAAKLGVTFPTVSRWERQKGLPSPLAYTRIEELLESMGDCGRNLLEYYFPNEEVQIRMQINLPLFPNGLDTHLATNLENATKKAQSLEPTELLRQVNFHLELAHSAAATNPMVHLKLAEALTQTYKTLIEMWAHIPEYAQVWLKGAMFYFVELNDADHDFDSPIGFEDDVEVLNACLRLAKLDNLCLNPEDFD